VDYQENIITDEAAIREIARSAGRVAVLGIKTEQQAGQPAFDIPQYLKNAGLDVVPVPVYYPEVHEIMGETVYRTVAEVPGEIDIVDVFRRPVDIPQHIPDIVAKNPKVVWFQSGIRNDEAAEAFAEKGIRVVQDHCLMVEHRRAVASN
jgi:predicted CoA-binding protein